MKQNINPVTLFSIKEGARIENTLFKAMKWYRFYAREAYNFTREELFF